MPKVSRETVARITDYGVAEDRSSDLDGYTVAFVSIVETHDLAPMLASLPGGRCQCPHWGFLFSGRMIVRYEDHEEVIEAGDAFYMPPGHAPEAEGGTSFLMFSPADQLAATEAAVAKGMQAAAIGG